LIKPKINGELLNNRRNELILTVAIHNIARNLYNIRYFKKDYEPTKCSHCDCGDYVPTQVTLGCRCVNYYNSAHQFFNMMTEYTLKMSYKVILLNSAKIIPIFMDFMKLHHIFENEALFLNTEFLWCPIEKRLKFRISDIRPTEKQSTYLKTFRLKKKAFQKKFNEMMLTSELVSSSESDTD
jgi:hypothetical protein